MKSYPKILSLLAGFLALNATDATAQTTPPTDNSVIELSPFTVSSTDNTGYAASESMTGSRVATKIIDLPYSIGVVTSELFEDFAIFELGDNLGYVSGFSDLDQGGSFNLRGIRGTVQLRDGFFRLGRYGSSNIDRMEIIKGPSAAVYGATSPGGMVNMISKKPKKKTSQKLSVSVGDFDTQRQTFEATGTLGSSGKTSYVAVLGHYDRGTDTELEHQTNKEAFVGVQHDFSSSSNLLIQAEYFLAHREAPGSSAPLILDDKNTTATTDDEIVGIASNLTRLQQTGPEAFLDRGMKALTATYSKTFSPNLSFRASANRYHAINENYANVGTGQVNRRTLAMSRSATPEFGGIYEDGGGVQTDLLMSYRTGKISHRTLFTLDYNDYYRDDPAYRIAGPALTAWNAVRTFTVNADLTGPAAPLQYITTPFDPTSAIPRRANKNRTTVMGALVRHQAIMMDGRLLVFGGGRIDYTKYSLRDELPAVPLWTKFDFKEFTPNLGANYKVNDHLRAFVNYSEGFNPNAQTITVTSINADYKSETSQGWDYGIKAAYLNDRLNFTLLGFYIKRQNVVVQSTDPDTLLLVNTFEGSQLLQGAEFDASWNFTEALSVTASLGYIDSQITDLGHKIMSIGRSPARIQPINASLTARYSAKGGLLKGFSGNVGVIFAARTPISNPDAGDTYQTAAGGAVPVGTFLRTTNEWKLEIPSYTVVNAGVRYTFNSDRITKLRHTFGLNVNNVLDKEYLKSSRAAGDRQTFFFNYTLVH
jgi:iron complex outermembrane recepter protein